MELARKKTVSGMKSQIVKKVNCAAFAYSFPGESFP